MVAAKGKKFQRHAEIANISAMAHDQVSQPPTDADAIRLLRTCMEILEEQMNAVPAVVLERQTGMLWARKLDYAYDGQEKSHELEHDARKAASYILIDQILFYQVLSMQAPEYAPLEEISDSDPSGLGAYFAKVLFRDYQAIFDIDILNLLPKTPAVVRAINTVIRAIKNSRINEIRRDILGKIFHQLIPMEIRRHLAAFYTSNEAAAIIARLAIDRWDAKVLDLACGSGTLLTEAYIYKQTLISPSRAMNPHRELLDQIYGNDVTQFAAHLATINLALQGTLSQTERVNVTVGDGFEISPATLMAHAVPFKLRKPLIDGYSDASVDFSGIDVVLMNPPFTQHKRLNQEEKEKIHAILVQEGLGKFLNGRMGLHALFILHADVFLQVGGKMALVLPANTFCSNYGKKILQLFREKNYSIDFLIERVGPTNTFSEQCGLKEYLLVVTKGLRNGRNDTTLLVTLNAMPIYDEIPLLVKILEEGNETKHTGEIHPFNGQISTISQESLLRTVNWNAIFQRNTSPEQRETPLTAFFDDPEFFTTVNNSSQVKIRRGFDGTHIEELSLPNATWGIDDVSHAPGLKIRNRSTGETLMVTKKNFLKSFRLPRLYEKIFSSGPEGFLLIIPEDPKPSGDIARYVEIMTGQLSGRRTKEKKEGAARARQFNLNWYSHTARFKCQNRVGRLWIVWKFNIKTRRGFGFYATEPGAAHNAFYQVICENPIWESLLATWFNSSLWVYQLMTHSRSLTSQYHQLMIEDVKSTHLPVLDKLDLGAIQNVIAAARALDNEEGDSFRELFLAGKLEPLDRAWLQALGLPPDDVAHILNELSEYFHQIFARFGNPS